MISQKKSAKLCQKSIRIAEDENGHNQVVSYAIVDKRTKECFIHYFEHLQRLLPNVSIFLTDRNITQIEALKTVWPNATILFCNVHIGRNIKDKVGMEMFDLYKKVISGSAPEEQLRAAFKEKISMNVSKISNFLQKLIECAPCCLPSYVNHHHLRGNLALNRVEGVFGLLHSTYRS